jgi:hypothetical protein
MAAPPPIEASKNEVAGDRWWHRRDRGWQAGSEGVDLKEKLKTLAAAGGGGERGGAREEAVVGFGQWQHATWHSLRPDMCCTCGVTGRGIGGPCFKKNIFTRVYSIEIKWFIP